MSKKEHKNPETEETVKLENVSMVLTAMIAHGITEDVTWLDVSNVGAIKFDEGLDGSEPTALK